MILNLSIKVPQHKHYAHAEDAMSKAHACDQRCHITNGEIDSLNSFLLLLNRHKEELNIEKKIVKKDPEEW